MNLKAVSRWHPFLILGLVSYAVVILPSLLGWDYDAHPLATLVFILGQFLGLVFHFLGAALSALNGGRQVPYQTLWVTILGLAVYVVADLVFTRYARRAK